MKKQSGNRNKANSKSKRKGKGLFYFIIILVALGVISSSGKKADRPSDADTGTRSVVNIEEQLETADNSSPTATPNLKATAKPTATPKPEATEKPQATTKPTSTPKPTKTPRPTSTPKSTKTPRPTSTPKPTATPTQLPTSVPTIVATNTPVYEYNDWYQTMWYSTTATPFVPIVTATPQQQATQVSHQSEGVFPTAIVSTTPVPGTNYVLNCSSSSMKFHYPWCNDVTKMSAENRIDYFGTREEVIQMGYSPCGHCKP